MSDTAIAPAATEEKPRVFLESDDPIRGQTHVCLSFLTPNRGILRNKDLFFIHKFLEFIQMDYRIRSMESFVLGELRVIQDILSDAETTLVNSTPENLEKAKQESVATISRLRETLARKTATDLETYVKDNMNDFKESSIVESYEKYMTVNRQRLEDEFHKMSDFQTTVHGLKVRGVYSTREQAVARAKALHKKDPYFNVFVADVGEWLPWDPEPEEVENAEYSNDDLNKLMAAYRENAAKKDAFFEEEKRQKLAAAMAAAEESKKRTAATAADLGSGVSESKGDGLFDGPADLAIARKQEAIVFAEAAISEEKISHI